MMPAIKTTRATFIQARAPDRLPSLGAKPGENDANDEEHR